MHGADGWQLSNYPVLSGAAHLASLQIFEEVGITALRKKSILLTGFMDFLLQEADPRGEFFTQLTPSNPEERGCQLSLFIKKDGKRIFQSLSKAGVIADWREPDVIRVAPVPLYNTFEEVFSFSELFKKTLR
jgi:kynureninase